MKLLSAPVVLAVLATSAPAFAAAKPHQAPAPQPVGIYPAAPNAPVVSNAAVVAPQPQVMPAPGAKPEYHQPRAHRQPQATPAALPE
jgi:hypothetical protein